MAAAEPRLILTICGSLRAGSTNAAVLRTAAAVAPDGASVRSYGGMGARIPSAGRWWALRG